MKRCMNYCEMMLYNTDNNRGIMFFCGVRASVLTQYILLTILLFQVSHTLCKFYNLTFV